MAGRSAGYETSWDDSETLRTSNAKKVKYTVKEKDPEYIKIEELHEMVLLDTKYLDGQVCQMEEEDRKHNRKVQNRSSRHGNRERSTKGRSGRGRRRYC